MAHIYANFINKQTVEFPAVCLVVSGGHTDLVLMKKHKKIKWLGGTRDDAAGECFDKTARVLGLSYPGGPEISRLAEKGNAKTYHLPRPMLQQKNLDFSFSGLKTAVINLVKKEKKINRPDLAASIQSSIIDCLVEKTIRAAKEYKAKSILLSGGVAANTLLREKLDIKILRYKDIKFFVPPKNLCTDNAAMIASCAYFNFQPVPWQKIKADPSLSIEEMI